MRRLDEMSLLVSSERKVETEKLCWGLLYKVLNDQCMEWGLASPWFHLHSPLASMAPLSNHLVASSLYEGVCLSTHP